MKNFQVSNGYHKMYEASSLESLIDYLRLLLSDNNLACKNNFEIDIKVKDPEWDGGQPNANDNE